MANPYHIGSTETTDQRNIQFTDMDQYADQDVAFFFPEIEFPEKGESDLVSKQKVIEYTPNWARWKYQYNTIPSMQTAINRRAMWIVGRGHKIKGGIKEALFKTQAATIKRINGNGIDTFNSVMDNMIKTYHTVGDAFADKIRDTAHRLINLKPLNPGSITVVGDQFGIIRGYKQTINNVTVNRWKPKDMFHLCWNRVADSMFGLGEVELLEWTNLALKEAKTDYKTLMHRYVKPLTFYHVKTDNPSEIASFKRDLDKAFKFSENMIIPSGKVEKVDRVSLPPQSTIDPLPWIRSLETESDTAMIIPKIIKGTQEGGSEGSAKVVYLAFQQPVEFEQDWLESQIKMQLGLDVDFIFPASLEEDIKKDNAKDSGMQGERKSETVPTKPGG